MERVRSAMAGTLHQPLLAQHKAELKRMNSELKSGLRESLFKEQITVNKKVTLALKTLGGLSERQIIHLGFLTQASKRNLIQK